MSTRITERDEEGEEERELNEGGEEQHQNISPMHASPLAAVEDESQVTLQRSGETPHSYTRSRGEGEVREDRVSVSPPHHSSHSLRSTG